MAPAKSLNEAAMQPPCARHLHGLATSRMWNLLRTLMVMFALAGFMGQTTARAMPMAMDGGALAATTAGIAMTDCADMPGMSDMAQAATPPAPAKAPCTGMTPDCMGKMGCATVATTPPAMVGLAGPVTYEAVIFASFSPERSGIAGPLPYHPPKRLA